MRKQSFAAFNQTLLGKANRESSGWCALAAESLLLLEDCGPLINDPRARNAHTHTEASRYFGGSIHHTLFCVTLPELRGLESGGVHPTQMFVCSMECTHPHIHTTKDNKRHFCQGCTCLFDSDETSGRRAGRLFSELGLNLFDFQCVWSDQVKLVAWTLVGFGGRWSGVGAWWGEGKASPGHPPEGFQVLAELLEAVSSRNKLLLTPLNQSLLHHLHTDGLQPRNLREGRHESCQGRGYNTCNCIVDAWRWHKHNACAPHLVLRPRRYAIKLLLSRFLRLLHLMNMETLRHLSIIRFYISGSICGFAFLDSFPHSVTDTCWP